MESGQESGGAGGEERNVEPPPWGRAARVRGEGGPGATAGFLTWRRLVDGVLLRRGDKDPERGATTDVLMRKQIKMRSSQMELPL